VKEILGGDDSQGMEEHKELQMAVNHAIGEDGVVRDDASDEVARTRAKVRFTVLIPTTPPECARVSKTLVQTFRAEGWTLSARIPL